MCVILRFVSGACGPLKRQGVSALRSPQSLFALSLPDSKCQPGVLHLLSLCIILMQVSIGLPTFLLNQDTKTTVVLVYVFALCIVVPVLAFYWYVLTGADL